MSFCSNLLDWFYRFIILSGLGQLIALLKSKGATAVFGSPKNFLFKVGLWQYTGIDNGHEINNHNYWYCVNSKHMIIYSI